jgi:TetR/AcrR family transcriptional regulator, repressor of fatR-cypB operon
MGSIPRLDRAHGNEYSFRMPGPADDKREAILAAALALFAERGFHGTAVPQIAARAQVGAGTIYRYFASKEAIVNALFRRWKAALAAVLADGLGEDQPPRAQLEHLVGRAFGFARRFPLAFAFLELHHHQPYLDAESRAMEGPFAGPARIFFDRQQRGRALRKAPPELLAALAWGAIVGVVKAGTSNASGLSAQAEQRAAEAIWSALAGDTAPGRRA